MRIFSKNFFITTKDNPTAEFALIKFQHGTPKAEIYHVCQKCIPERHEESTDSEVCPHCHKEIPPLLKLAIRIGV